MRTDLVRQRVSVDRQVGDAHRRAGDVSQRVDRGAAGGDVCNHLAGDLRRVGRHPRSGDPVIAGENHNPSALELLWRTMALTRCDPD